MKLRNIVEEFVTSVKAKKDYVEIFKNPSKKELQEVKNDRYNDIRFIIDLKTKEVYIFSSSLLHHYATEELGIPYEEYSDRYIFGVGTVKNGKIIIENRDQISGTEKIRNELLNNLESYKIFSQG